MTRMQIIRTQEHSRKDLLKTEKTEIYGQKITFNATYYQDFQNVRNVSLKLYLLLAPDKELKNIFPGVKLKLSRQGDASHVGNFYNRSLRYVVLSIVTWKK